MSKMKTHDLKKAIQYKKQGVNLWRVQYKTGYQTIKTGFTTNEKAILRVEDINLTERARGEYGFTLSEALLELKKVTLDNRQV